MSQIEILISEEKGVRKLHFGSEWVQGAMRISRPLHLELEYTRDLLAPLLLNDPSDWPKKILCIGLGVGALPKFFHAYLPDSNVETVEICPAVLAVCQQHFKLPALSDRFEVHIDCGADFLAKSDCRYDLIVVDGFDQNARVGPLDSSDFFKNASSRLTAQGLLVTNILSHELDPLSTVERLGDAFKGRALALPPCASGNVIAVATGAEFNWPDQANISSNQSALESLTQMNLSRLASKLSACSPI